MTDADLRRLDGGADVAWLADELGQPARTARVLAACARWELTGGATGVIASGLLGWAVGLPAGRPGGCTATGLWADECVA